MTKKIPIAKVFQNLTPKQRGVLITALDMMRINHYGDMPISRRRRECMRNCLAFLRNEITDDEAAKLFGKTLPRLRKIKEKWIAKGYNTADRLVVNRLAEHALNIYRINSGDKKAIGLEYETFPHRLKKTLADNRKATPVVELGDDSIKKLAEATGKSVKKAIKPGKGSSNERYTLKDKIQIIWEKYKDNSELKASLNHKVYHRDVFEYGPAHAEIVALRNDPPITLEEFERSLGAVSDKNYRESPAMKKKKPL